MSTIWRGVWCGIAFVLVGPWAAAQEPESDAPVTAAGGPARRITVTLGAKGELHGPAVGRDDPVRQPISMQASFDYVEAPAAGDRDLAAVRKYREATATIGLDGSEQTITLPPDARSILVARLGTTPVPHLQDAYLSRDELELLEIPFDPLLLDQMLPDRPVSETEQWQVSGDLTAGMLAIDTVETGGLVARVSVLDDGVASVVVEGTVDGAVDGVPTHVIVSGSFTVAAEPDEDGYLLTGGARRLDVVMRELRQASHVAAGFEIEARLAMRVDEPGDDVNAAAHGDADAPAAGTRRRGTGGPGAIWYRDPEGRYDIVHESGWRCVEEDAGGVVLRLLDLGALVAQCSITVLPRAEEAARPTLDEVRRHVERSLSGQFQRFADASETTREADGARVIRVVSEGTAEDLPFRWVHYVVTDDDGHRVHATFMYEASLERRFSAADTRVIDGLRLAPEARREAGLPRKTEVP